MEGSATPTAESTRPSEGARSFQAFISYSTDPDYRLSQRVESFLETFHKLKLPSGVELRPIQVCRDGSDFSLRRAARQGAAETVIEDLIASYLADSEYLVVLCSPTSRSSYFVNFEIRWFLENRGPEYILLAVTEGQNPSATPELVFPDAALEAQLHRRPFYDLRGFKRNLARSWTKVRDHEEELAGLAAFLHGDTSGRLLPIWQREILRRARRQRMIFAVAALVLALITGFALWQRSAANAARDRAERALADSRATSLVIVGEESIARAPQLSLLLGIEAAEIAEANGVGPTRRISSLLKRAVLATPRRIGAGIHGVECFALRPDGKAIAVGTQNSGVFTLSLGGNVLARYPSKGWVDTLDWSSDGTLLAVGARDKTVVIWNTATKESKRTLEFQYEPQSVDWRPATHQLAVGLANGEDSRTSVWDEDVRSELFDVVGMRAAWSPDGELLAAGGGNGGVHVYDASGKELADLPGHTRYVHKVAWRFDSQRFATASVDDHVIVWNARKPKPGQVVKLSSPFALSAAWNKDGSRLASGSGDQFVKVWKAPKYETLFTITKSSTITGDEIDSGAAGYVLDVSWSPDGKTVLVADREAGILVYASRLLEAKTLGDWVATGKAQARRKLTPAEQRKYGLA